MNRYKCTYTIDGFRVTLKDPIEADTQEQAEEILRKRLKKNITNIVIETLNDE